MARAGTCTSRLVGFAPSLLSGQALTAPSLLLRGFPVCFVIPVLPVHAQGWIETERATLGYGTEDQLNRAVSPAAQTGAQAFERAQASAKLSEVKTLAAADQAAADRLSSLSDASESPPSARRVAGRSSSSGAGPGLT